MQSRIRVVVLNYNGGQLVLDAVDSIVRAGAGPRDLEVVVVDNASTDGSADALAARFAGVAVRRNPRNTGFPANNLALFDLDGVDYVALVNPDCVVGAGWLEPLVAALEADAGLGAACPLITFFGTDEVQNAGGEVLADGYGRDRAMHTPAAAHTETVEVFAWCGAAVLLRPAYLADVGLFDERLFLYYEDTDLSWRGLSKGWRYQLVPESRVAHHHSASVGVESPLHQLNTERNRLVVLVKNAPWRLALTAVARFPLSTLSIATRGRQPRRALRRARAYAMFFAVLPSALRARRRIDRARTVPAAVISRRLVASGGA